MKRPIIGVALLALALSGCASFGSASLTTTQVYVAANAFDAAELTATNYLGLPVCTSGGVPLCRTQAASAAVVAAARAGYKARQSLVSACSASIPSSSCVSAYTAVTTAVSGLQNVFTQYSIQKDRNAMSGLATAIVAMLSALLPLISGTASTTIDAIINVLVELIPDVVNEVEQVGPVISNVIAALKSNTAITAAQLAQLATVEAQYDAAFEAAATAAGFPAPAAAGPQS